MSDVYPSLDNGEIAYHGKGDGDWDIYYWTGSGLPQKITIKSDSEAYPSLDNGEMAWVSNSDGDNDIYYWTESGAPVNISNNTAVDDQPSLADGQVVWYGIADGDYDIYYWDGSGAPVNISGNDTHNYAPDIYDGTVAWYGNQDGDADIYFWDGASVQNVSNDNPGTDLKPSIYEGQTAYYGHDGTEYDIYLALNLEYYFSSMSDTYGLGYVQADYDVLAALILNKVEEVSVVTSDGREWQYFSDPLLPGDDGSKKLGDYWFYDGKYYLKNGSGAGTLDDEGGENVPELSPGAVQFMVLGLGGFLARLRRR